jgi:hypothetical protein
MKWSSFAGVLLSLAVGCSSAPTALLEQALPEKANREAFPPGKPAPERSPRKLVYTATIDLLVDDFSQSVATLDKIVGRNDGFLAQSQIRSDPGTPRIGCWRVRILVEGFTTFVNEIAKLGEARRNQTDSEDITDKFFDVQIRVQNKKVQVERLQKIIQEQTGKVSDLLEAERELGRVTTELEQLEGSVKLWNNQIALATVNITMNERQGYAPSESPTFGRRISRAFWTSVEGLTAFVQVLIVVAVTVTPWVPMTALIMVPIWLLRNVGKGTLVPTAGRALTKPDSGETGP